MPQQTPELIELRAASAVLGVSPVAGGSITRYASDLAGVTREWMRPALADAIRTRSAGSTSSFPLVPFSNRIRNATFRFRGRVVELGQNFPPGPHAIHGHAWREAWTVLAQSDATLTLEYRHTSGGWPWPYRAEQSFDLMPDHLSVRFAVTNESSDPMPVGFGLHPYFVRTPQVRLRADVARMWRADANEMPVELVTPPPQLSLGGTGLNPDTTPLDNNFIRFGGRATIDWPEWNARLEMTADPIYACVVVYTPPGRDFFCVEPVTNCIDGFNLAEMGRADTGVIVLAAGDTAAGHVTFTPAAGL